MNKDFKLSVRNEDREKLEKIGVLIWTRMNCEVKYENSIKSPKNTG